MTESVDAGGNAEFGTPALAARQVHVTFRVGAFWLAYATIFSAWDLSTLTLR